MRRIVVSVLAAALLGGVAAAPAIAQGATNAAATLASLKDAGSRRVLVTAHRAVHDSAPENSMPAIEQAIAMGVDIIEIDVRLTKDGVPVLMHDAAVDRTTTGTGKVNELTFEQVRALKLKDGAGKPTGLIVPTLAEALRAAKGRVLVDLDLKADDVDPILSRVIEAGMLDQCLFFNEDSAHLQLFSAIAPGVLVFPRAHSTEEARAAAATFAPELIHIDDTFNTEATREAAKPTDSRLWINALGEPDKLVAQGKPAEAIAPLLAHGASIIQTDHPAALLAYLASIGRR